MKNIVDEIDIWLGKYRETYLRKRAKPIEELRQIAEEWQSNSATAIGWADELAKNNFAILVLDSMKLKFFRNRDDFDMANQTLLNNNKRLVYLKKSENGECWIKPDDYNM